MSNWIDLTERESVARAIRDASWTMIKPAQGAPPNQAMMDTLPLTDFNLACADAAIGAINVYRRESDDV